MIVFRRMKNPSYERLMRSGKTGFGNYSKTIPVSPNLLCESKSAFTLAETLITLSILGIVAAIAIPSLTRAYIDRANKTKIKKAMAVYEKLMPQLIITENIKSNAELRALTCSDMKKHFKVAQDGSNDCVFKTGDGIWWTVRNGSVGDSAGVYAYVGFKEENIEFLDNELLGGLRSPAGFSDEPVFGFTAGFDGNVFRVNQDATRLNDYFNGDLKLDYNKKTEDWIVNQSACISNGGSWNGVSCDYDYYNNPQVECESNGGSWTGDSCLYGDDPETICISNGGSWTGDSCLYGDPNDDPETICISNGGSWNGVSCDYEDSNDPQVECESNGGYWTGDSCHDFSPQAECESFGGSWDGESCQYY